MQSMNRHSIGLLLAHVTLFGYSIYSFYGSDIRTRPNFCTSSVTIIVAYKHTAYSTQHTVWPSVVAYLLSIDIHLDIGKREEYIVDSLKRIPTSGIRCACVRQWWLVVHIFFCQCLSILLFLIFVINNFEYLYSQIQLVVYGQQFWKIQISLKHIYIYVDINERNSDYCM